VSMLDFYVPGETVGTWDITGGGKWATLGDWSGAPPQTAGDTANFTSAITANATVKLAANWSVGTINFANSHSYTLGPGTGGTLTMDNGANSAAINVTQGSHFITAPVVLNSTTVATIGAGDSLQISSAISGAGGLTVAGSGTAVLSGTNSYTGATTVSGNLSITKAVSLPAATALSIQSGGDVALATNIGQVTVKSISAVGTGKLDLANNHLIINYGSGADPISSIAALIKSGYAAGKWNGPGIDSSAAAVDAGYGLGYADGTDGDVAGLSSGQVEIKFTLLGDANLDGEVNGADFTLMAANFNLSGRVWDQGDFNYDGDVNGSDFVLLADNFNQFASQSDVDQADLNALDTFAAANGISLASIPEPSMAEMLLPISACATLLVRRRAVVSCHLLPQW
jgi:autotransporter-associated beta strand protein